MNANDVVTADLQAICERASSELSSLQGTSLLVVGGGGFLGHYLVQGALAWNRWAGGEAISVTLADNWSRGTPAWVDQIAGDPNLQVRTLDITRTLDPDLDLGEWVVHAASIASPTYYRKYPIETMDANVNGLRRLLDRAVADRSLNGLMFFSTSEIYGDPPPDQIPTPETFRGNVSCTGPRACYDESKRYGETLCVNFARVHDLPIKIVRPFNNYGPGLSIGDGRVIPDFARDVLAGRDIRMLSSGFPTRTFCYVADAVVGYFKVLVQGTTAEPYNIGTPGPEISIAELAERMATIGRSSFDYEGCVVTTTSDDPAYLVDNPDRRCPDITKARNELGFEPIIDLEDGLQRSLTWYRDHIMDES